MGGRSRSLTLSRRDGSDFDEGTGQHVPVSLTLDRLPVRAIRRDPNACPVRWRGQYWCGCGLRMGRPELTGYGRDSPMSSGVTVSDISSLSTIHESCVFLEAILCSFAFEAVSKTKPKRSAPSKFAPSIRLRPRI